MAAARKEQKRTALRGDIDDKDDISSVLVHGDFVSINISSRELGIGGRKAVSGKAKWRDIERERERLRQREKTCEI